MKKLPKTLQLKDVQWEFLKRRVPIDAENSKVGF